MRKREGEREREDRGVCGEVGERERGRQREREREREREVGGGGEIRKRSHVLSPSGCRQLH